LAAQFGLGAVQDQRGLDPQARTIYPASASSRTVCSRYGCENCHRIAERFGTSRDWKTQRE
jgi:hypothetical protein